MTNGPAVRTASRGSTPEQRGRTALTVASCFVVVMSGSQLVTPLLALYGREHALDAVALALVYSAFLAALVPVLLVLSRPTMQARPVALLTAALVAAVVADVVLLSDTVPALFIGRALNGLALGLGAGSTSALTVALSGERARTLVATSTILGALVGTVGTVLLAQLVPMPLHVPFVLHGLLTIVALVRLRVRLAGRVGPVEAVGAVDPADPAEPAEPALGPDAPRPAEAPPRWVGFVLGAFAWTDGAIIVSLVPLAALGTDRDVTLLEANAGAACLLAFAVVGQFALARIAPRPSTVIALTCLSLGIVCVASGLQSHSLPIVYAGCAAAGVGQGLGYRTGLAIVTAGSTPAQQGARTSAYACIAYAACAALLVLSSVAVSTLGYLAGFWVVALSLVPVTFACCVVTTVTRRTTVQRTSSA